jgi:hypothetical protein
VRIVGPGVHHAFHFERLLPLALLGKQGEGRTGPEVSGTGGRGVEAGEDAGGEKLEEGETAFVVEGGDLVVPVLAVVEPHLADLGLLAGERVGEVVVDAEGLAEVTQLLVRLPPDQPVPAQLELLIARLLLQVRTHNDLLRTRTGVLPFWAELRLVLEEIETAVLVVATGVGEGEELLLLVGLRRTLVDASHWKCLLVATQLKNRRDDVVPDVEVDYVAVDRPHQDGVSGCGTEGTWNAPFSTDITTHASGLHSDVLDAEIAFGSHVAKALVLEFVGESDQFL